MNDQKDRNKRIGEALGAAIAVGLGAAVLLMLVWLCVAIAKNIGG